MRYTKIVKIWSRWLTKELILAVLIVGLSFGLRINRYWDFPVGGETQDETAWAFLGASLIQTGQPTSWSFFAPYNPDYILSERENMAPLVRPALDHPPLFSLLPGFFHALKTNWQTYPSIKVIRLPMVLLGTFNVALLMLVASRLFKDKKWIYLSGLIYGVAPSFVFSSRLVVAENLIVTWTLLALLGLTLSKWRWQSLLLIIIGVAAILTKVSGLVVPVGIFIYGLASQDKKIWKAGLLGGLIGIACFVIYGALYNFGLFIEILRSQAGRDLGWSTLQNRFFLHADIVEKIFFDGWILLGLFAGVLLLWQRSARFLAINTLLILNLFFILLTSGEQTFHGWYDFSLYPLLVLATVEVLREIFAQKNWLLFAFVWLMLLPILRMAGVHGGWYQNLPSLMVRLVSALGFLPFFFSLLKWKKFNDSRWLVWVLFSVLLIASVYAVLVFNQVSYWEEHQFFREW